MIMVRQPISLPVRVGLGIASVLVLVTLYGLMAHQRQRAKRANAAEKLTNVQQQLSDMRSRRPSRVRTPRNFTRNLGRRRFWS